MTTGGPHPQSAQATAPAAGGRLRRLNVTAGNLFFRYRNTLFPVIFALTVLLFRPRVILNPALSRLLIVCGAVIAVVGEFVRLVTIGYEYIERGGKEGKVYASRLVQGGIYAHTRNPMYLGNLMIAIGMSMFTGAPAAYMLLIPVFLYIYQAITATEEGFLRNRFGQEYEAYCSSVPRFAPSFRGLT